MADAVSVSIVLGSGGARGYAHIGVLEWLRERGYVVRSIAGSSMGALIGGIYATGKLDLYTQWVLALERMDVLRLLDPSFGRGGFIKGDRIMGVLRDLIGDCRIEDLPVSYTAVATDLDTGKEVWLREGKLFDAIRASIAIPLVFMPAIRDGRRLLDGAVVNPIPIAPTLNDTTDLTIAVDLCARAAAEMTPSVAAPPAPSDGYGARIHRFVESIFPGNDVPATPSLGASEVMFAAMEAMQTTIARLKMAAYSPDITIEVPRNACAYYEFWRAKEMIALGRACTEHAFARRAGNASRNEQPAVQ
jgi:NTE family protein